jgi:hypothetical protein
LIFWWWFKIGYRFESTFDSGANPSTGGSIAIRVYLKMDSEYGSAKIILGADANNEKSHIRVVGRIVKTWLRIQGISS